MMRVDKIYAATMNINLFSKRTNCHCRALNMPTWPAFSKWTIKRRNVHWLVGFCWSPQSDIKWMAFVRIFQVFFKFFGYFYHLFSGKSRKLSKSIVFFSIEIYSPIYLIGKTILLQSINNLNHLWDLF